MFAPRTERARSSEVGSTLRFHANSSRRQPLNGDPGTAIQEARPEQQSSLALVIRGEGGRGSPDEPIWIELALGDSGLNGLKNNGINEVFQAPHPQPQPLSPKLPGRGGLSVSLTSDPFQPDTVSAFSWQREQRLWFGKASPSHARNKKGEEPQLSPCGPP